MFEIKLIASPIDDQPGACECRGYAGTANNMMGDEPFLPTLPDEPFQF